MDSGMFRAMQSAAAEALKSGPEWFENVNTAYRNRRKIVEEIMVILDCKFDPRQAGLFLWGRIPESIEDCGTFVDEILEKAHVFITPGFVFGSKGERYIRISLCADEKSLTEAKRRILNLTKSPFEGRQ